MDGGWHKPEETAPAGIKVLRLDKVSRQQCDFLSHINSLEKLYLLGPQTRPTRDSKDDSNNNTPLPRSPASSTSSPSSIDTNNIVALKDDYLEAIIKRHGHSLKHLLLLPQWRLTDDDIAFIVRQCPNLEQLGMGVEFANFKHLRLLVPFLSNLTAIRLLGNPDDPTFVNKMRELDEGGIHERKIGEETVNREWSKLKYMEVGAEDMIFEVGPRQSQEQTGSKGVYRRPVKRVGWESVKDIDIWKLDSMEI